MYVIQYLVFCFSILFLSLIRYCTHTHTSNNWILCGARYVSISKKCFIYFLNIRYFQYVYSFILHVQHIILYRLATFINLTRFSFKVVAWYMDGQLGYGLFGVLSNLVHRKKDLMCFGFVMKFKWVCCVYLMQWNLWIFV